MGACLGPECREIQIVEGEVLSGNNPSVHSNIKVGAYAGRLANLNLSGMNNPSPNLNTVYLDTPLVGPTPEPLEYVPLPGRLGHPSGVICISNVFHWIKLNIIMDLPFLLLCLLH